MPVFPNPKFLWGTESWQHTYVTSYGQPDTNDWVTMREEISAQWLDELKQHGEAEVIISNHIYGMGHGDGVVHFEPVEVEEDPDHAITTTRRYFSPVCGFRTCRRWKHSLAKVLGRIIKGPRKTAEVPDRRMFPWARAAIDTGDWELYEHTEVESGGFRTGFWRYDWSGRHEAYNRIPRHQTNSLVRERGLDGNKVVLADFGLYGYGNALRAICSGILCAAGNLDMTPTTEHSVSGQTSAPLASQIHHSSYWAGADGAATDKKVENQSKQLQPSSLDTTANVSLKRPTTDPPPQSREWKRRKVQKLAPPQLH
ncbi:hypothetical protein ED733_003606 [Metarhizium rileyi]|uniref:Uncharacterized protein n=1 Tax=Metarhizium rileyi (strain RCEF 4871) TaxID=1649241 RepID=A0A5C6GCY6_METRR|nr:hypothetical protein ED733_003606 [Metarhizium rileyi]